MTGTGSPLGLRPPRISPPSCDPPQHPKRDAALGSRPALYAAARGGAPSTRPKRRIFGRIGAAKRPHFFKIFVDPRTFRKALSRDSGFARPPFNDALFQAA